MHKGNHTCVVKRKKIYSMELMKEIYMKPGMKPSQIADEKLVQIMSTDDFNLKEL